MQVWVDGRFLSDADEPAVAATDHGFTVGDAVFEAIKVVRGEPFALTRHLQRLRRSAAGLGLPEPDVDSVRQAVAQVLAVQRLELGRVRITWTGGRSVMGSGRTDQPRPTLVVAAAQALPAAASVSVITVPWPRNERGAVAGLKTTSYAENVVALAHAHEHGADEALFANTVGHVCEGTGTNVFYVVDGELRTPSLASGCLDGVTRQLVLEWVGGREVDEPADVLGRADEVFLTSTTRDVQPVHRCDGRDLSAPGPVTAEAMRVWAAREPESSDP
ncbi:aminodeoxychorismate lyase [Nocardioides mangrovicus]|uniref:aminodeoxychorismate lyase n=1 Tax=Nocardioides mangrovicus TaxID=2478913 RepID=A0A3L8P4W8_9ACTN|nr:aminodeoxychorismate lyase [Nocardioides mangrovicus]RLV50174.1 aminodeoxychorismate lyase [Nocardioides mangrovicus]